MHGDSLPFSAESIRPLAAKRAGATIWLDEQGPVSWSDFGERVKLIVQQCANAGVRSGSVVITPAESRWESLAWLFGVALLGGVVAPLRNERRSEISRWKGIFEIGWQVVEGKLTRLGEGKFTDRAADLFQSLSERGNPGLILATGGTTGTPKLVLHDLATLLATSPVRAGRPWRILPLMRFDHIGGLDMAWRALAGGQVLVGPPDQPTPERVGVAIERHRVEVLPATASFLNLLLIAGVQARRDFSSLQIVPYGAEPMSEGLLHRLRAALPKVQFVQRFGTSETGALPVKSADGGLELAPGATGFAWKIVDRELWIRSPARALGYLCGPNDRFDADGWFRTGDMAEELAQGGIRILGRRDEMINVGGEKVIPSEVESTLLENPLVADCSVGGLRNAVLGQVVAADIVWRGPERDALDVKRKLHEFAAGRMARHKLPAVIRLVDQIAASGHLKKFRPIYP